MPPACVVLGWIGNDCVAGKVDEVGDPGFRNFVLEAAEAGKMLVVGVIGCECAEDGVLIPEGRGSWFNELR